MNPIILPIGETRNMLDFINLSDGKKIVLNKSEFINVVERFKTHRENIQGTGFFDDLFRLMYRADCINIGKILNGFPVHTIVYLLWYHSDTEQDFYNKWGSVEIKDPEVTPENLIEDPTSELFESIKLEQIKQSYIKDGKALYGNEN